MCSNCCQIIAIFFKIEYFEWTRERYKLEIWLMTHKIVNQNCLPYLITFVSSRSTKAHKFMLRYPLVASESSFTVNSCRFWNNLSEKLCSNKLTIYLKICFQGHFIESGDFLSSHHTTFIPTAIFPIYLGKSSAAVATPDSLILSATFSLSAELKPWLSASLDLAKKIGNKLPSRINEFRSFLSRCFWHALQ